ncbi:MAG: hypothetical protein Q8P90_02175, partial [bacterium]|nr:hypothetical protein [bacterium]
VNDNGDYFSDIELRKSAHTFIGVPMFTNHQNDDIEKAKGKCVHAWYDEQKNGIFIISSVDKVAYPQLARGIESGYISGSSMGTAVDASCCSICHNFSHVSSDYCSHIKEKKNRKLSGTFKCEYHSSITNPKDNCRICGCKQGESKQHMLKEQQVFEHNYGLKFIEDSFVVNPACHDCLVECIIHKPNLQRKVAELSQQIEQILLKTAMADEKLIKQAGSKELGDLKEAMSKMEQVTRSMLSQKEHISMGYVSDLVEAMEKVQDLVDELNDMGYSRLPSPQIQAGTDTTSNITQNISQPQQVVQPQITETPNNASSSLPNDVGSITKPRLSNKILDETKEFIKISTKIETLNNFITSFKTRGQNMSLIRTIHSDNGLSISFDGNYVTEAKGDNVLKISHLSDLSEDIQQLFNSGDNSNIEKAANKLFEQRITKESRMSDKQASIGLTSNDESSQSEVITEKQLAQSKNVELHPRTGETYVGITESKEQLGLGKEPLNQTTSESPQVRKGNTPETITEDQLDSITSGYIVRWKEAQDVITEKQWNEFSKAIASQLKTDQKEHITEAQLQDLLSNHKFVGSYETITEDQLKNQELGIKRWASPQYAKSVVKIASNAIADAIAYFHKTPLELSKLSVQIQDNDGIRNKIAFLTILNALPHKKEDRIALANNVSYFRKKASKSIDTPDNFDSMIISVANNAKHGFKVEDVYEAVSHVLRNKEAMSQVDKLVQQKLQEDASVNTNSVDKISAMDEAIAGLDGRFKIYATVSEIKSDPGDKTKFITACQKYAQSQIGSNGENVIVLKIQLNPDGVGGGVSIEGVDDEEYLNDGESPCDAIDFGGDMNDEDLGDDIADPDFAPEHEFEDESKDMAAGNAGGITGGGGGGGITSMPPTSGTMAKSNKPVKQAQMMGGQMGGQGGASQAPGAGASLPGAPTQPGAAQPQGLETLTQDDSTNLAGDDMGMDEDNAPAPPGAFCYVCGGEDVDLVDGKWKCNNPQCGANGTIDVNVKILNHPGVLDSGKEGEEDTAFGEGEGFELPENSPQVPVAASTKLTPEMITKLSNIEIGSISPVTGKPNTVKLANGLRMCLDTGTKYVVQYMIDKKNPKITYAQCRWIPKVAGQECLTCNRTRNELIKSLAAIGVTESDFDHLPVNEKTNLIMKVKADKQSSFNKTASTKGSALGSFKQAFAVEGNDFPIESCREKLARRFGENALALSGPCEGKPIHDCVCNSLKSSGIYTDKVAVKLANIWMDRDGDEECVEHQIRSGYAIREAVSRCENLKQAMASSFHKFADELGLSMEHPESNSAMPVETGDMSDLENGNDFNPFTDSEEPEGLDQNISNNVTLELPMEVVEQLDKQLDKALGDSPEEIADEDHHQDIPGGVAEVNVPEEVAQQVGDAAESAVDKTVDTNDPVAEDSFPSEEGSSLFEEKSENEEGINSDIVEDDELEDNHPDVPEGDEYKEGEEENSERDFIEASVMRSDFGKTGKMSMNLDSVFNMLNKQSQNKDIRQENVQDSKEIGKYTAGEDGSTIGHEDPPKAAKPSVPRDKALMGHEAEDLNPQDKPQPEIPVGSGSMGHEEEQGYTGGDDRYTGGRDGAGKTQTANSEYEMIKGTLASANIGTSKERLSNLVSRMVEAQNKKLEKSEPVADDPDIQPVQENKDLSSTPEHSKRKPSEESDTKALQGVKGEGNASMMGHENETLGDKPDSPKDHPEIPAKDARMGEEGEQLAPEKETKNKGTVIASGDSKSETGKKEAYRVAGRMLQAGLINADELQMKVNELSQYKSAQIKDYEKSLFASKKGFTTAAAGGIEKNAPVINQEVSESMLKAKQPGALTSQLQSLFTLGQRVAEAESDENFQWKKSFNKL